MWSVDDPVVAGTAAGPAPAATVSQTLRVSVGGVAVHALDAEAAAQHVLDATERDEGGIVVTPNLDHLHKVRRMEGLRATYDRASLILADGMPLLWASRLQGTPLPGRVAGSDFLWSLAGTAQHRARVYLLGGRPGAADEAARRLCAAYPGLAVVGTSCPPHGFEADPVLFDQEAERLRRSGADIVFLGLGTPKQEVMSLELADRFPEVWFVGVGAGIDMAAGIVQRAPEAVQRLGLEWMYRLVQEPRRLARRYLVDGLPTAGRLLTEAMCVRLREERRGRSRARASSHRAGYRR